MRGKLPYITLQNIGIQLLYYILLFIHRTWVKHAFSELLTIQATSSVMLIHIKESVEKCIGAKDKKKQLPFIGQTVKKI